MYIYIYIYVIYIIYTYTNKPVCPVYNIQTCFSDVLHQNKVLYNFHERGEGLKARCYFCVD